MTNSTFEIDNLPDVPGGTWRIINEANNPEIPTSNLFVRLSLEGQDDIDVGISSLEIDDIMGGIQHAYVLYQHSQAISAINSTSEIFLVPRRGGEQAPSDPPE